MVTMMKAESVNSRRYRFSVDNQGNIFECYRMGERLGAGSFGSVRRAVHLQTQEECAVKTVSKVRKGAPNSANMDHARQIDREIELMKSMDHPNVIRLLETFEDEDRVFLVMEVCQGGELFDLILDHDSFGEAQAAVIMKQVFSAAEYMHGRGVVHRDIKPANLLFLTRAPIQDNVLKIIDFGLSIQVDPGQALRAQSGTPFYMSPQVLKGTSYDSCADMWGCGVILYVLLCGYPPFNGARANEVTSKVIHGNYFFSEAEWASVSQDARDLIRQLLRMNAKDRLSASQALEHRWITSPKGSKELPDSFQKNLRVFRARCSDQKHWNRRAKNDEATEGEGRRSSKASQADKNSTSSILDEMMQLMHFWFPTNVNMFCCADNTGNSNISQVKRPVEYMEVGVSSMQQEKSDEICVEEVITKAEEAGRRTLSPRPPQTDDRLRPYPDLR